MNTVGKVVFAVVGAGVVFLAFVAVRMDDPEVQAKHRERRVIMECRDRTNDELLPPSARLFNREACERLTDAYDAKYGTRP